MSNKRNVVLTENGPGFASGLRDFPKYFSPSTISTGIIAAIMGCTGPAILVINAAKMGNLSPQETASWLFAVYFFGGLMTLLLAMYYKQPICGAWSIPGVLLVGSVLNLFNFNEAVGAFLVAGIIVLIVGLTGMVRKIMLWIPQPIIMGMIAGAMFRFGTGIPQSIASAPGICLIVFMTWLLLMWKFPKFPHVLGALIVGLIVSVVMGYSDFSQISLQFIKPQIFMPQFSVPAMFSIAIPLALMVITAENTQAMGVLMAENYKPPINTMTIISGIGGIITSIFGGHNANIAGPMTAITSSPDSGPQEGRYVASSIDGILFGGFGLVAGAAASIIGILPKPLIGIIVGLTMIGVLSSAFLTAWSGKFKKGAFFSLVTAASGVVILKIGAPFWALVIGVIVSLILEKDEFEKYGKENSGNN